MLAADTNVVVRLLVSDDLAQQEAVRKRLERASRSGEAVLISPLVLAEVAWVLDSVYGYSKDQISLAVRAVVSTPPFLCPERAAVLAALDALAAGAADFPDYLILALAQAAGASTLLTFDRRLLKHGSCRRP
jgi:predicted nucleic-acid-binding protein